MKRKMKRYLWELRKKAIRRYKVERGVFPRAMIPLTLENAKRFYGRRKDVTVHSFIRKGDFLLPPPKHLPEDHTFSDPRFHFPQKPRDYDAVILDIRNPKFTFQHLHLLDDKNRVIYAPQVRFDELPIEKQVLETCERKLEGTVAYLSNSLSCHYAHWIQLQFTALAAYWETFGKENIDYYYIGEKDPPPHVLDSLEQAGIRREQIVNFPCRADRSLISMMYINHNPPELQSGFEMSLFSYDFIKTTLFKPRPPKPGQSCPKKIYVMRGKVGGRRERNQAEVRAALEPHGFTSMSMEGKTMQEEADLFGNADVIVAVHGAALHNQLFARPGTQVIELFPYDYFEPSNYVIASHSGCEYYYLIGEPLGDTDPDRSFIGLNRADIVVDPSKLLRLLEMAGLTQGF